MIWLMRQSWPDIYIDRYRDIPILSFEITFKHKHPPLHCVTFQQVTIRLFSFVLFNHICRNDCLHG